jgi:hypothetical protein
MTVFEYSIGLISIVVGLAVARALGGIGTFMASSERSAFDWIGVAWCAAILMNLIGWWIVCWTAFSALKEVGGAILVPWVVATALLYLAAYALVPSTEPLRDRAPGSNLFPLLPHFYLCLAAHFGVTLVLFFSVAPGDSAGILLAGLMIPISAAGALVETNRARAMHLLIWVATMVILPGGTRAIGGAGP